MSGKVQISASLFCRMASYIMDHEDPDDIRYGKIMAGINNKLEALHRHNLYSRYKTARTLEEQEQARLAYLDAAGIYDPFRWINTTSPGKEQE